MWGIFFCSQIALDDPSGPSNSEFCLAFVIHAKQNPDDLMTMHKKIFRKYLEYNPFLIIFVV